METSEVRTYYNESLKRESTPYEQKRWFSSPTAKAGYDMTKTMIERHVRSMVREGMSIAELGPGGGTWTRELYGYADNLEFDLVDISREMLNQARKVLPDSPRIQFIETDFLQFQPTRQYDYFFSSRVLEYFPEKEGVVATISKLLKSDGQGFLITKMPHYSRMRAQGVSISDFHSNQIEPNKLKKLFENNGFRVTGLYPATGVFPKMHSATLDRLLFSLFSRFPLNWLSRHVTESYCIMFEKHGG